MSQAAENDVKERGIKGLAAWGIPLPFWMKASWFKKHGYIKADKQGIMGAVLLWKPFTDDAIPPKWIKRKTLESLVKNSHKAKLSAISYQLTDILNNCAFISSVLSYSYNHY